MEQVTKKYSGGRLFRQKENQVTPLNIIEQTGRVWAEYNHREKQDIVHVEYPHDSKLSRMDLVKRLMKENTKGFGIYTLYV